MPGIGIGISPHFQQKKSLLSYWTTRYPSALQAVPYSGTRIDLAWTNNGTADYDYVSLEGSTDGVTYTEYDTATTGDATANITGLTEVTDYYFRVRYVKGSSASAYTDVVQTFTYPTALLNGHYKRFDFLASSTITKDANNLISAWADINGSGVSLANAGADNTKPVWSTTGVYFDTYIKIIQAAFAWTKPLSIYLLAEIIEYRVSSYLMYGDASTKICLYFDSSDNNNVKFTNGSASVAMSYQKDVVQVHRMTVGADGYGYYKIDDNSSARTYLGTADPGALVLRSHGITTSRTRWKVREIIIADTYDYGTANETSIYNYLVKKKS